MILCTHIFMLYLLKGPELKQSSLMSNSTSRVVPKLHSGSFSSQPWQMLGICSNLGAETGKKCLGMPQKRL